jgi:hypothetical protein
MSGVLSFEEGGGTAELSLCGLFFIAYLALARDFYPIRRMRRSQYKLLILKGIHDRFDRKSIQSIMTRGLCQKSGVSLVFHFRYFISA